MQQGALSYGPALLAPQPEAAPPPTATLGTTAIYAETSQQVDTVAWALDQFVGAGFELPPVTIHMHTYRIDCSSDPERLLNGYYKQVDGNNIIHSCGNRWTLLHELAHVWDKTALDDTNRKEIMAHQGLETWSHETWNQAGGEHLASIVAWALEGTHPTRIGYYTRTELAEAYFMAAGSQPPLLVQAINSTRPPHDLAGQTMPRAQSPQTAPPSPM